MTILKNLFYFGEKWSSTAVLKRPVHKYILRLFGYKISFSVKPGPFWSWYSLKKYISSMKEEHKKVSKEKDEELIAYEKTCKWLVNELRCRGVEMYPVIKPSKTPSDDYIIKDNVFMYKTIESAMKLGNTYLPFRGKKRSKMETTFPQGTPVVYHLFDGKYGHEKEYGVFIDNLTNRRCIVHFKDRVEAVDKSRLMKRDGIEHIMIEKGYFSPEHES